MATSYVLSCISDCGSKHYLRHNLRWGGVIYGTTNPRHATWFANREAAEEFRRNLHNPGVWRIEELPCKSDS